MSKDDAAPDVLMSSEHRGDPEAGLLALGQRLHDLHREISVDATLSCRPQQVEILYGAVLSLMNEVEQLRDLVESLRLQGPPANAPPTAGYAPVPAQAQSISDFPAKQEADLVAQAIRTVLPALSPEAERLQIAVARDNSATPWITLLNSIDDAPTALSKQAETYGIPNRLIQVLREYSISVRTVDGDQVALPSLDPSVWEIEYEPDCNLPHGAYVRFRRRYMSGPDGVIQRGIAIVTQGAMVSTA